jgi:ribosome biogenesis GTPase
LALIQAVLPRRSGVAWHRRSAGEQVLAANVDLVLVVAAPGRGLDPWRVERLLAAAWESGARPVVLLARADRCPDEGTDVATELRLLAAVAPGVPVHAVSGWTGEGLDEVAALLAPGATTVLLGPPGAGKSTLVNRLAGRDLLATGEVADDGDGRHIAGPRQLLALAGGALVIDTPGLRELGAAPAEPGAAGARAGLAAAERRRRVRAVARGLRAGLAEQGRD